MKLRAKTVSSTYIYDCIHFSARALPDRLHRVIITVQQRPEQEVETWNQLLANQSRTLATHRRVLHAHSDWQFARKSNAIIVRCISLTIPHRFALVFLFLFFFLFLPPPIKKQKSSAFSSSSSSFYGDQLHYNQLPPSKVVHSIFYLHQFLSLSFFFFLLSFPHFVFDAGGSR